LAYSSKRAKKLKMEIGQKSTIK
jgi:hypothetical protein